MASEALKIFWGPKKRLNFWILDLWVCLKKVGLGATVLKFLSCIYSTNRPRHKPVQISDSVSYKESTSRLYSVFLRKVCLSFNFWMIKFTIMLKKKNCAIGTNRPRHKTSLNIIFCFIQSSVMRPSATPFFTRAYKISHPPRL